MGESYLLTRRRISARTHRQRSLPACAIISTTGGALNGTKEHYKRANDTADQLRRRPAPAANARGLSARDPLMNSSADDWDRPRGDRARAHRTRVGAGRIRWAAVIAESPERICNQGMGSPLARRRRSSAGAGSAGSAQRLRSQRDGHPPRCTSRSAMATRSFVRARPRLKSTVIHSDPVSRHDPTSHLRQDVGCARRKRSYRRQRRGDAAMRRPGGLGQSP